MAYRLVMPAIGIGTLAAATILSAAFGSAGGPVTTAAPGVVTQTPAPAPAASPGVAAPAATQMTVRDPNEVVLHTTAGMKIYQTYNPADRSFSAMVDTRGGRAPLRNGSYRLSNGGAIKVANGKIVWDAFGIVRRINAGTETYHPGTNNG
jgi:hypothetical protein